MSLIVFEDGKLKIAETEPLTRSKLLADATFCTNVADVTSYIISKEWERASRRDQVKFFKNDLVTNQLNTSIQEKREDDTPFSIDSWYRAIVDDSAAAAASGEIDWMSHLIEEELRTGGGFVAMIKNCVDMEDRLTNGNYNRMRTFVTSGGFSSISGGGTLNPTFFTDGGISAPFRK